MFTFILDEETPVLACGGFDEAGHTPSQLTFRVVTLNLN